MTINKKNLKSLQASFKAYKSAVKSADVLSVHKKEEIKNQFFMIESKNSVKLENKSCRACA